MGDEPLNPLLKKKEVFEFLGEKTDKDKNAQYVFDTPELYEAASKKFDIYHITVKDHRTNYDGRSERYENEVDESFKEVIGKENYIISSVDSLKNNIVKLVERSYKNREHLLEAEKPAEDKTVKHDETGAIVW